MSELIPTLKYADLLAVMMEPNWADVSPSSRVALAFHLPPKGLPDAEVDNFENWHSHQPIPVIGLLAEGCESASWNITFVVIPVRQIRGNVVRNHLRLRRKNNTSVGPVDESVTRKLYKPTLFLQHSLC